MRPVSSEEELRTLRSTAQQRQLVSQAREGSQDAKRKLLQFNYSCLPNPDGSLKGTTRLSDSVGMDIDLSESENESEKATHAIRNNILARQSDLGLLLLEHSVNKGYHLVFKRHPELTQEQNLRWASTLLGIRYDEGAKDHTRVFFSTTASPDDLISVSPKLFDNQTEYPLKKTVAEERHSIINLQPSTFSEDYDGIPYSVLVEALAEQLGGIPVHGSRNNFIFSMACNLRYVCNDDPHWIRQVLPTYGENPDKAFSTIQSACNRAQSRTVPSILQRAIAVARSQTVTRSVSTQNPYSSPVPPEMPSRLPHLISLLVSKVPAMYHPAVAQAVFPPLGAHLHGVTTRYIDNSVNDLGGFMSICMAKQSSGKSSVNKPIELIMEDILQRDVYNRDLEKQWKEQYNKAKEGHKPSRPADMCVQYLMSNMTNAALVLRLLDAQSSGGRFLYTRLDEIELLDQIKATGGSTSSELIRLAFNQSLYGQERVGSQSVTGTPPLRFNFNASTTIPSGQKYFRNGFVNGTLSRLTFSTIVKPAGSRGIPTFGNYDDTFRKALKPYITNLNAATGLIQCRQAEKMSKAMMEELYDVAELSDDDIFETLSYRANRIAYDKAVLLYIAHGNQWTREIAEFCRWSMQYDLWCKLHFFGQSMCEQVQQEILPAVHGPQNMLDMLPDRFSRIDLQSIHRAQGRNGNIMQLLYTWSKREYIRQDQTTHEYVKTEKYLARHNGAIE